MEMSKKWVTRLTCLLLILVCSYIFWLLSPVWRPILSALIRILTPFMIAGIVTYLLHPIIEQLKNMGVGRPLGILLIYVIFMFLLVSILLRGTPYIVNEFKELIENIPTYVDQYRQVVEQLYKRTSMMPEGMRTRLEGFVSDVELVAADGLVEAIANIKNLLDYLLMLIIIPFVVFYLLKDFHLIEKSVWYLTPRKWRSSGRQLLRNINISLGNYIRGQIIVCVVVGVIATIGLLVIGMPYAVILGIFIGLTNIIPYFGPLIGALPVVAIAFTVSFRLVLAALIVNFTIQLVEGNILSPLIVGKSLHMHPILIIFALVVGAEVGGIIGLILSVPILAVVKVIAIHIRELMTEQTIEPKPQNND
ncbi:MAG: AI-2E family transporter [Bacillaceae bacterium]|nr:AI-2E family transporter [Bacillaceae bacterium]